jgi:hypothetical protein
MLRASSLRMAIIVPFNRIAIGHPKGEVLSTQTCEPDTNPISIKRVSDSLSALTSAT